ncbi:MAG TPA: hypothetical protein VNB06_06050 [Thermoanaerobaculia bacterium]|nr:hypothetical protein [Thermoanaerobaculia bacterium]
MADDFIGRAWVELYRAGHRAARPLRTVSSYGERDREGAKEYAVDDQMLEELEALGYLQ